MKAIFTTCRILGLLILGTVAALAQTNHKVSNTQKKETIQPSSDGSVSMEINLSRTANLFPYPFPDNAPRQVTNVPEWHFPPAGECRIWYPDLPIGHQPASESCQWLSRVRLTNGAFILHGRKAYDTQYDWLQYEQKYPGSVPEEVLHILFPHRGN